MKRRYIIGISIIALAICLVLVMCKRERGLSQHDKDEVKNSDYIYFKILENHFIYRGISRKISNKIIETEYFFEALTCFVQIC